MQTVILAAGRGTRMAPLTDRMPKPMLPVGDRPLVEHAADVAVDAGATELIVVTGYRGDAIREYLGEEFRDVPVTTVTQDRQLGTADAVRATRPMLRDESFAVLNGDVLYDTPSVKALFESGPGIAAYRVDDPSEYGVLRTDGDRVTGVVEKPSDPPSNLINAGAYVFPAETREWLDVEESDRGEYELTDVLERVCGTDEVRLTILDRWLDVGRPWELLEANEWMVGEVDRDIEGQVHPDAELRGAVVVESGATVDAGVVVDGPALIRDGATVGPNAYVRGHTLIDVDATIGHAVEVKNSVVMRNATVGHLSYVGDSVLGRNANLGAGTTIANLRHDAADVRMRVKGERTSTGRRKFGAVLGDDAKTGINTSLNAGVTLDTGATTGPGETVLGDG